MEDVEPDETATAAAAEYKWALTSDLFWVFVQGFQKCKNAIQGLWAERDCGGDCQASSLQIIKGGDFKELFVIASHTLIKTHSIYDGTKF